MVIIQNLYLIINIMRKYKITEQKNFNGNSSLFHVYRRVFFFFWERYDSFLNLENAKAEVKYLSTKEIRVY